MYMCTLYREPKGTHVPYIGLDMVYIGWYIGYTGIWYIGWLERWTNGLDSMPGMMVESLTNSVTKSVHWGEAKSVHRSESVCDEESVMNDMKRGEEM